MSVMQQVEAAAAAAPSSPATPATMPETANVPAAKVEAIKDAPAVSQQPAPVQETVVAHVETPRSLGPMPPSP